MYVVGLTGGIGSGKSTVAARCAERGWSVVDADAIAREVVAPGERALDELAARFGDEVVGSDGALDRAALARLAFVDDTSRAGLDAITHPHIAARITSRLAELADRRPSVEVAVVDHPLLIETGQVDRFDALIVVLADEERRVERLITQRGLDAGDARARIRAQTDDATRRAVATYVIENDGDLAQLSAAADRALDHLERAAHG